MQEWVPSELEILLHDRIDNNFNSFDREATKEIHMWRGGRNLLAVKGDWFATFLTCKLGASLVCYIAEFENSTRTICLLGQAESALKCLGVAEGDVVKIDLET